MTWICGYRDGTPQGRAFQMPDWTHGWVTEADAAEIAAELRRSTGAEPHILTVRGRLIRLARTRKDGKE
ncbi:MAG: hypothetical protein WCY91_07215 [Acidithiobacillus sp.]|jgi:hypothetical protein|uniref:hypothetical protein n=1 Tax=Acidithiobacillus sp. TaxID=1872118 RepID=UPI00355E9B70